jgi:hypothetical protein
LKPVWAKSSQNSILTEKNLGLMTGIYHPSGMIGSIKEEDVVQASLGRK